MGGQEIIQTSYDDLKKYIFPDVYYFIICSQMKSPAITTLINGKSKTLYMKTVKSIEEKTRENLNKSLKGN